MDLELKLLDLDLSIAKLTNLDNLNEIIEKSSFFSLTKTDEELSLVIETSSLPEHKFANAGWKAFKISGPLDFSLVGILHQIIQPLSENGISIFTISTFDTDYILIREEQIDRAITVLSSQFKIS